jgi:hypothetical protein
MAETKARTPSAKTKAAGALARRKDVAEYSLARVVRGNPLTGDACESSLPSTIAALKDEKTTAGEASRAPTKAKAERQIPHRTFLEVPRGCSESHPVGQDKTVGKDKISDPVGEDKSVGKDEISDPVGEDKSVGKDETAALEDDRLKDGMTD